MNTSSPIATTVLLRVKPWRAWPAQSRTLSIDVAIGKLTGKIDATVVIYGGSNADALEHSARVWRTDAWSNEPRIMGHTVLFEHGKPDALPLDTLYAPARFGDVDIICRGDIEGRGLSRRDVLEALAYSMAASLMFEVGEPLRPVAPATVLVDDSELSPPFDLTILPTLDAVPVDRCLAQAARRAADGSWADHRRLTVLPRAVRRLMSARLTIDPSDRYLDYWQVCEFLASRLSGRNVALRVAELLADHLGRAGSRGRHTVHSVLGLRKLETLRNDVAHGNVSTVPENCLALASSVAEELLRHEIGKPYAGNRQIDAALDGAQ